MGVRQPIFVIGAGRSGSTALHRILVRHPQVAWLSGFCSKYPTRPHRNRLFLSAIDWPLAGGYLQRRFLAWEVYDFWETFCRGFSQPCRDLLAEDVTPVTYRAVREVLGETITARRNRLCVKITGWPRIGFLKQIFADARFVHIVRDGRAVANSNLQVDFWDGWKGPGQWRFGPLSPEEDAVWIKHGQSFVALAGIEWNRIMAATIAAKGRIDAADYLEIKYEDLCARPVAVLHDVVRFCGLEWGTSFERHVRSVSLVNRNPKWRQDLTPAQQAILEDVVKPYLAIFGYE